MQYFFHSFWNRLFSYLWLVICSPFTQTFIFLYICHQRVRASINQKFNIWIHRTLDLHLPLAWVIWSGHFLSTLRWSLAGYLGKTRSEVIDQSYLLAPSWLEEMLNSVNTSFFWMLNFLITCIFALQDHFFFLQWYRMHLDYTLMWEWNKLQCIYIKQTETM